MKAVVTVVGLDKVGILAKVSAVCAEHNANVIDVTQSVMQKLFTMIMLIDISDINSDFSDLQNAFNSLGEEIGMKIHVMHEDIFNSMHHI
jgi:ACT domain-containing protein